MRKKIKTNLILISLSLAGLVSCQKEFLDTKPNKSLLVPETLSDFRALLDNLGIFNKAPGLTEMGDGDFTTTDAGWKTFTTAQERNSYIWQGDIFGIENGFDWNAAYQQVFYANIVLDGLQSATTASIEIPEYQAVKGTALFSRAWAYYGLLQMFGPTYNPASAATSPGVPIRLVADVNQMQPRATVQQTYDQILVDLHQALPLLPATVSFKSRPGRAAVYGLLARTWLALADYNKAGAYADSALQVSSTLLDYSTLSTAAARPFPASLPNGSGEVIYHAAAVSYSFNGASAAFYCDSILYRSYAANDLRKTLLFKDSGSGKINFKGSYTGAATIFSGLATDEMYLIRSECLARTGKVADALLALNTLVSKRWKKGTYVPYATTDAPTVLKWILTERRKELVGRNMRWADLKRLNVDPALSVKLMRQLNGVTYLLEPGSKRYDYPIAPDELRQNNLVQNER